MIVEKRSSLTILADYRTFVSDAFLLTEHAGNTHEKREQEQAACNDEGEDPLEGDDLGSKLSQCQC